MRLAGRVALVTGASQGIGLAVATLFAAQGATVIATDIQEPVEPYDQAALLGIDPLLVAERIQHFHLDVSSEEDWAQVVGSVTEQRGRIDILINNAGIGTYEAIVDLSLSEWNRVISVIQTGTFLGMREVIPVMKECGGGSIVNFSSIWGNSAIPGVASYHAAKGAVRNMSKNAAVTYAPDNIRVNSVHPGFIDTPATRRQDPSISEAVIAATPLGRPGLATEVAHGCLFLASDESTFVTGAELVIDGGYLAR